MRCNPVNASDAQIEKLFNKHLKPFFGIGKIISKSFSYDFDSKRGFVTLHTITGKTVEFQLIKNKPIYVQFYGFGDIRYEISYPTGKMFKILEKYGIKAQNNFWNGRNI
jgi:hypothetical protein